MILLLTQFSNPQLKAQDAIESLTSELTEQIKNSRIPGMAVTIASSNGILYSKGLGIRDVAQNLPYDSLTVQPIASISKTFIGIALLKLVEENKVDLDTDINSILPFKVINPYYPESKITLLDLATHTSSITDTYKAESAAYYIIDKEMDSGTLPKSVKKDFEQYSKTVFLEYDEYLKAYLSVDGEEFEKRIFGKYQPGTNYLYSNLGASLAAYIIEIIADQSFEEFTKEHIFEPLNMENTRWSKQDVQNENVAKLYFHNEQLVPTYTNIFFPSSSLQSNATDMGKYMLELIKGFNGHGSLLKKTSYEVLLKNQILKSGIDETHGIFWQVNKNGTNIGHTGSNFGVTCRLIFNPQLDKVIFVMMNMSFSEDDELKSGELNILRTLSEYSKRIE